MIGAALIALLLQAGPLYAQSVMDGRCFIAQEQAYCLAGVGAPDDVELPERDHDLVRASKEALQAAIAGGAMTIDPVGEADRWGRQEALVFADGDPAPIQVPLLNDGHLFTVPDQLPPAYAAAFQAAQLTAQMRGRPLWQRESTRVLYADEAGIGQGAVRFVRGRVLYSYEGRDWTYLNFGPDWQSDFTIMIKPGLARRMAEDGYAPAAFEGRLVEVYGLIHDENGPAVELTSGAAIRIIPETD